MSLDLLKSYGVESITQETFPLESVSMFSQSANVYVPHHPTEYTIRINQSGLMRMVNDLRRNYITRCIDACGNEELQKEFELFLVRAALVADKPMPKDDGSP